MAGRPADLAVAPRVAAMEERQEWPESPSPPPVAVSGGSPGKRRRLHNRGDHYSHVEGLHLSRANTFEWSEAPSRGNEASSQSNAALDGGNTNDPPPPLKKRKSSGPSRSKAIGRKKKKGDKNKRSSAPPTRDPQLPVLHTHESNEESSSESEHVANPLHPPSLPQQPLSTSLNDFVEDMAYFYPSKGPGYFTDHGAAKRRRLAIPFFSLLMCLTALLLTRGIVRMGKMAT